MVFIRICFLWLITFSTTSFAIESKLVVGVENLLPHSGHKDADGEGYANVLIKEAFKDFQVSFKQAPYARLLWYLNNGEVDIILLAAKYDFDNEQHVVFPQEAIASSTMSFFVRYDNTWSYKSPLKGGDMVIGLVEGLVYPEIEQFLNTTKFNYYMSGDNITRRSLELLLKGKLTTVYEDRDAVIFSASKMGIINKIRDAGTGESLLLMYPAISSKRVDALTLANRFDQSMRLLREKGKLSDILKQYNKVDWYPISAKHSAD